MAFSSNSVLIRTLVVVSIALLVCVNTAESKKDTYRSSVVWEVDAPLAKYPAKLVKSRVQKHLARATQLKKKADYSKIKIKEVQGHIVITIQALSYGGEQVLIDRQVYKSFCLDKLLDRDCATLVAPVPSEESTTAGPSTTVEVTTARANPSTSTKASRETTPAPSTTAPRAQCTPRECRCNPDTSVLVRSADSNGCATCSCEAKPAATSPGTVRPHTTAGPGNAGQGGNGRCPAVRPCNCRPGSVAVQYFRNGCEYCSCQLE
eukprot:m.319875 g.319875  ORF g.319875 m.319875 type:complete len:263 (+) comp23533_c0_seq1:69-857(+)